MEALGGVWEADEGVLVALRGALEGKRGKDSVRMAQEFAKSKIPQESEGELKPPRTHLAGFAEHLGGSWVCLGDS